MISLPETALAFARECMGWEDCKPSTMRRDCIMYRNEHSRVGPKEVFALGDTGAVIDAMRAWCSDNEDAGFTIHFTRRGLWKVMVQREHMSPPEALSEEYPDGSDDLCHALMLACLEAARKLKEQAA